VQTSFRRTDRAAEDLRGLGLAEILEVAQDERRTHLGRQTPEFRPEILAQLQLRVCVDDARPIAAGHYPAGLLA
jgi:hypothetical protein